MTLTKKKMISEIGRRTRLKNRDIQAMLEALVEVWTEELVSGGRIELEGLFILETREIDRGNSTGTLGKDSKRRSAPKKIKRVVLRSSRKLKTAISLTTNPQNEG